MTLQTQNLTMVGLGTTEDDPPNQIQPPLVDGIHLRWAFTPDHGFPWHGFYLFRRLHRRPDPICLSEFIRNLTTETSLSDTHTIPGQGRLSSDQKLILTDDFPASNAVEFDLDSRSYLQFTFPVDEPVFAAELQIGFRDDDVVEATAFFDETPVVEESVAGQAGEVVTLPLEFDAITSVEVSTGPAALVDLCFWPISRDATSGWEPIPDVSYPLCLPVTNPDYPCTSGASEDLAESRDLARSRVRYGDPAQFTSPPDPIHSAGTISVVNSSPIVTGTGTDWTDELTGATLQVSGDATAYTIIMVVGPEKLVLSRDYAGSSSAGVTYAINQDDFGQLHDYLAHLVQGGTASGPMANRSLPLSIHTTGTIAVEDNSSTVTGTGTDWGADLTGLVLQVGTDATGAVSVTNGSPVVTGNGTNWEANLAGMTLRIAGEQTSYTISQVDSPTQLKLKRDYFGSTGTGKAYTIVERTAYSISNIDSPTQLTLDRNYTGTSGAGRDYVVGSTMQPTELGASEAPRMMKQHPLDLVLLGTLEPAIAQMLGLYWIDETADPDSAFDYLIIADDEGIFDGLEPREVLNLLKETGFSDLDGYIVFNKRMAPAPPLSTPEDVRAYALPGNTRPTAEGELQDASNNAGLRWDLGTAEQEGLLPDKPVMYHLWRADLGGEEPADAPPEDQYQLVTENQPVLVTEPLLPSGKEPQRPPNWPPFPTHTLDTALAEGWYSYQVSGIDIFGRHSPNSDPGEWYQWQPEPDPRPWYYEDPTDDRAIHPFAVGLLDKIPPPPPMGIEAYALDPADPTVLRDAAYTAWQETLSPDEQDTLVGLRVRWLWTQAHMRQAPDTREFRIYYHPERMNALLGRTLTVSAVGDTESDVETDIPNTLSADAYVGCRLQIGSDAFEIIASEAGDPLSLRVRNIGPGDTVRPQADAPCTIAIPSDITHPLSVDHSVSTNWKERYYVVDFDDPDHVTITTDSDGQPLRQYEIFLPAPDDDDRDGLSLSPSLAEPVVYARVGVSATDNKTHTLDDPKWDTGEWGNRFGNEGRIGVPATIFRVLREPPEPPAPPAPDSDEVFATPADYHGHSYFTYRWQPQEHLKTHVLRALDDAVFKADWSQRPRPALDSAQVQFFPSEADEPRWDAAKRQQVVDELNELNTFGHDADGTAEAMAFYRELSNDALRVLAGLPGNERAFTQVTVQPLDPDDPENANRLGPDNPVDFPIDPALRIYIDTLDGRSTNRYFYSALYVDGAHNRSDMSLASPPVYLPDVVPPRAPVITKVLGGDREITLRWVSNWEPDLAEYQVYRADSEDAARDVRLMTLVHSEPVPVGDPSTRPGEAEWTDQEAPTLTPLHYRIVAADEAGNASKPSISVAAQAYDDRRPAPPVWDAPTPGTTPNALVLSWSSPDPNLRCLVQRNIEDITPWENLSGWLPRGVYTYEDTDQQPSVEYVYRLKVMDVGGKINRTHTTLRV